MDTSAKHLYETTVIINAALEDQQVESVITRLQELIARNGGEIEAVNRWGRKRLTYPIKKKNNGFYLNLEFKAPGTIVKALEHVYLLDEQILRFLTIKMDKKALKARELGPRVSALPTPSTTPPSEVPAPAPAVEPAPVVEEKPSSDKAPLFAEEPAE